MTSPAEPPKEPTSGPESEPPLPIVQAGEPVLRRPAADVPADVVGSHDFRRLVAAMRSTMYAAPGVGLAAPQIGVGLRVAVLEDREEHVSALPAEHRRTRERDVVPFTVLVNPIVRVVEEAGTAEFYEGCLSVDGWTAAVVRARRVEVDHLDELGEPRTTVAHGWHARIVQHEVDHLNGVLYVDRMEPRSLSTNANYAHLWAGSELVEVRRALGF